MTVTTEITAYPPIGGARGITEWQAHFTFDGKKQVVYAPTKKAAIQKARRLVEKLSKK